MNDYERVSALPSWGDAEIPADRDRSVVDDAHGFADIVQVFVRTWPFLAQMIFGRWEERPLMRSAWLSALTGETWSFRHGPLATTILAALGPLTGLMTFGQNWQLDLLVGATMAMAALCWVLIVVAGRAFLIVTITLVIVGGAANLFAIMAVTGWQDNAQVALVTLGCLSMWMLQYRTVEGVLQLRYRLGCHLVYYYAIIWLSTMVGMITGLFTIDLLNQSILQAQPLTDFVANFIGRPELSAAGVETLTVTEREDLRWLYIMISIGIGALMLPFGLVLPYYHVWIMQTINEDLRLALVERWHQLSLRYHTGHRVGDSVYRIYQDSAQVTAIIGMVISILTQMTQYAIALVFVAALDPVLGLMVLTAPILAIMWARWFSPRMRTRSLVARETNSDLTSRIQEVLGALPLVKICGSEALEQQRFEEDSVVAFNSAYRVRSLVAVITIVMFTLTAMILLGGEFLMAVWASDSRETFAAVLIGLIGLSFVKWNLAAFQWAQGQQFVAGGLVQALLRQWTMAQDMAMGLERVFDILDIEPEVTDAPDAIPMPHFSREVRFDHVSFAYQSDRPVLKDVSFTATPGTITAIVGPTGSGKSTLAGLISRLFDPDTGTISIDGNDLRKLKVEGLRENVSIALQENLLFSMSVRDNIRYVVPNADDRQVHNAAEVACVDDYIAGLPDGLDTMLGDRGGKLSTGQRQRLSIARAIAKDAPILILDEPTAALDANTEQKVLERLADWGKDRAILLITHRISTIQRADQILYLDAGSIIEQGSHSELMTLPDGRYRRFVETEAALARRPEDTTGEANGAGPEDEK